MKRPANATPSTTRRQNARWWGLGALGLGLLVGAAWMALRSNHTTRPSPPAHREWTPPTGNALLTAHHANDDEPAPLVAAWETQSATPTFVLYADGSWVSSPNLNEAALRSGQMDPACARELHRQAVEADLLSLPAWQTRTPFSVDSGSATYCTQVETGWACATLDGADQRRPWHPPDAAGPAPVSYAHGGSTTLLVPPAIAAVVSVIESVQLGDGGLYASTGCSLRMRYQPERIAGAAWPSGVPAPRSPPQENQWERLSPAACTRLEEATGLRNSTLMSDGAAFEVSLLTPRVPNQETLMSVKHALSRFVHPEWY